MVVDGTELRIQEAPDSWSLQDKGKRKKKLGELPGEKEIWAVGSPSLWLSTTEHMPVRKLAALGKNHRREQRLQLGPVPIARGTERPCGRGSLIYIPPLSSTPTSEWEVHPACGNSSELGRLN